jgi:hypothetical protein
MIGPAELEDLLSEFPERFVPLPQAATGAADASSSHTAGTDESPSQVAILIDPMHIVRWWLGATAEQS